MCFSANASFTAAGVLTAIGGVTARRHRSRRYLMLAALPLVFAAQQVVEGMVWLSMHAADRAWWHQGAVSGFLAFAVVLWPTWVPMAMYRAEAQERRRRVLRVIVWIGVVVSAYAVLLLIQQAPTAAVAGHSISYGYHPTHRWEGPVYLALYLVPTVTPFFVSHMHLSNLLGAAFLTGLAASVFIRYEAITSVWCFFAAILSGLILASIELTHRRLNQRLV